MVKKLHIRSHKQPGIWRGGYYIIDLSVNTLWCELVPVILGWRQINPLNAELNPIRHLLALVEVRHIVHVSRVRVNVLL